MYKNQDKAINKVVAINQNMSITIINYNWINVPVKDKDRLDF